jgi:transcription elongation factor GreA
LLPQYFIRGGFVFNMSPNKDFYLTSNGLKELKVELKELEENKRPRLIERVTIARDHGDLAENSEYTNARDDLAFVEGRIEELQELITKAKLIRNQTKGKQKQIQLGCKVMIKVDGKKQTYEVVGEWEADPLKQKISHTSPLGKALIGKKAGEKIEIEAPAGKVTYLILKIY